MDHDNDTSSNATDAILEIRNLCVEKSGKQICSVADLSVPRGSRVAIVGGNGTGKTTLLRVIGGLETGFTGSCKVQPPICERVFVHQSPYVFRGTVLSNVSYGLRARGPGARGLSQKSNHIEEWLDRFNLRELMHCRASNLSGGERRRVALARAMILQPKLLLLDEPTSDLDAAGKDAVRLAIDCLSDTTVIIASPVGLGRESGFAEFELVRDSAR